MSLQEKTWFLFEASQEQRQRWIDVIVGIDNVENFLATDIKHKDELRKILPPPYSPIQKYIWKN
jgi:hypothetical protein